MGPRTMSYFWQDFKSPYNWRNGGTWGYKNRNWPCGILLTTWKIIRERFHILHLLYTVATSADDLYDLEVDFGGYKHENMLIPYTYVDSIRKLIQNDPNSITEAETAQLLKATKNDGYKMLYIHYGKITKLPAKAEWIQKLYDELIRIDQNAYSIELEVNKEKPKMNCVWKSFSKGTGLMFTKDQESFKWLYENIPKIEVAPNIYLKAWHKGEKENEKLVSACINGETWKDMSCERLIQYLANKNNIEFLLEEFKNAESTSTENGISLRFTAGDLLWKKLIELQKDRTQGYVELQMGLTPVKFNLFEGIPVSEIYQ